MNSIAHLVRGDLRHLRWALLVWIVLIAVDTVLTGVRPTMADPRASGNLGIILGLLWFARQLAMLLLVPLIIQAHPAVGTDAFWMTRPIPPLTLFGAKATLLATLLLVVPALAQCALMLSIGVPGRRAAFVVLDDTIVRAAWVAVLAAGAVLTLNLPRFALLCGAVFLSFVLTMAITLMTARYEEESSSEVAIVAGSGQPVFPPAEDPTQGIVFLLGVTAAGLALTALQYRTRLRRVSLPVGVGGLVLLAFAVPYWPFPLLRVSPILPSWAHDPAAVRLQVDSPVIDMTQTYAWSPDGASAMRRGTSRVIVSGLEPGWVPELQLRRASVTLANGSTLVSRERSFGSTVLIEGSSEDPSRVAARQVLGVTHVLTPLPYASEPGAITLVLPSGEIDQLIPAQGAYRGEFAVFLTHWEVAAALSIRAGAAFQDDGFRFAIDRVSSAPGAAVSVRAREWRATSSFDRKPRIAYAFYIRNAQHTHAMAGHASDGFGSIGAASFALPFSISSSSRSEPFYTRAAQVFFPAYYGQPEQALAWEPGWNDGAELVIVRRTETGAVVRSLEIPQASLTAKR